MARLAEAGAHVVHCPQSNLKLASGFCPVARLLAAGVNVALGTDGAASNNDLDLFGEMRTAALLGKGVAGSASAVPARAALRMATIDAARAPGHGPGDRLAGAGQGGRPGGPGLRDPDTEPVYHPLSQLVYAAARDQIATSG